MVTVLSEVEAIAGSPIDPSFGNPFADRLHVAKVSVGHALEGGCDLFGSGSVETVKPGPKRGRPIGLQIDDQLDHACIGNIYVTSSFKSRCLQVGANGADNPSAYKGLKWPHLDPYPRTGSKRRRQRLCHLGGVPFGGGSMRTR